MKQELYALSLWFCKKVKEEDLGVVVSEDTKRNPVL
jgi:hypothetical protein